jgi:hypothetical protein
VSRTQDSVPYDVGPQAGNNKRPDYPGQAIYSNYTLDTTIKELFQNAFDAIKAAQHQGLITRGTIDITSDNAKRIIVVKDNGIGMTADTVRSALLSAGGSDKSDLPLTIRSGGGGIGKDTFAFGVEAIKLSTVRDGIKTQMLTSSERLKNRRFEIVEEPTRELNGTTISVRLPSQVQYRPGEPTAPLYIPASAHTITPLNAFFTGRDVAVTYNGEPVTNRPKSEKNATLTFDWGKVDVYLEPSTEQEPKQQVLSAGAFHFTEVFKQRGAHSPVPFDVALDVYPAVAPTDPNYPFDGLRRGWRDTVLNDVATLRAHLDRHIEDARTAETAAKFYDLKIMPRVDPRSPMAVSIESIRAVRLSPVPGATGNVKARFAADMADVPADQPLLHSNLDLDLPLGMNQVLIARNMSPAAVQMFSELGSVAVEFTQTASRLPGYQGLAKYRSGISLDRQYAGVNIAVPFDGIFVNPYHKDLFLSLRTPRGVAGAMLHVLKHEAVHVKVRAHNSAFAFELGWLDGALHDSGDQDRLLGAFSTVVRRHWQTYLVGSRVYEHGSTANIGQSTTGRRFDAIYSGTDASDTARRDRTLPNRPGRPGISAPMARITGDARESRARPDAQRAPATESKIAAQNPAELRRQAVVEYQRHRHQHPDRPPNPLSVKRRDTDRDR